LSGSCTKIGTTRTSANAGFEACSSIGPADVTDAAEALDRQRREQLVGCSPQNPRTSSYRTSSAAGRGPHPSHSDTIDVRRCAGVHVAQGLGDAARLQAKSSIRALHLPVGRRGSSSRPRRRSLTSGSPRSRPRCRLHRRRRLRYWKLGITSAPYRRIESRTTSWGMAPSCMAVTIWVAPASRNSDTFWQIVSGLPDQHHPVLDQVIELHALRDHINLLERGRIPLIARRQLRCSPHRRNTSIVTSRIS